MKGIERALIMLSAAVALVAIVVPLWRTGWREPVWRLFLDAVLLALLGAILVVAVRRIGSRPIAWGVAAIIAIRLVFVLVLTGWYVVQFSNASAMAPPNDPDDRALVMTIVRGTFMRSVASNVWEVAVLGAILWLLIYRRNTDFRPLQS